MPLAPNTPVTTIGALGLAAPRLRACWTPRSAADAGSRVIAVGIATDIDARVARIGIDCQAGASSRLPRHPEPEVARFFRVQVARAQGLGQWRVHRGDACHGRDDGAVRCSTHAIVGDAVHRFVGTSALMSLMKTGFSLITPYRYCDEYSAGQYLAALFLRWPGESEMSKLSLGPKSVGGMSANNHSRNTSAAETPMLVGFSAR